MYMIHTLSYTFNLLNDIFARRSYMFNLFSAKIGQDWTHYIKKTKQLYDFVFSLYISVFDFLLTRISKLYKSRNTRDILKAEYK